MAYALSVHTLLRILKDLLTGVTFGRRGQKISVAAYADAITVLPTHRKDFEIVHQVIQTYERAKGAQLNPRKSKALPLGGWSAPIANIEIETCPQVTIIMVKVGRTMDMKMKES
jgi:hypothetical protein